MSRPPLPSVTQELVVCGQPDAQRRSTIYRMVAGAIDRFRRMEFSARFLPRRTRSRPDKAFQNSRAEDTWRAGAAPERDSSEMTSIVSAKADNAPGRNWDRLMAAAQMGDANAYRILLHELAVWLRWYYAGRLPPVMTEDAVQDALLAIHEKRHTYDPKRPFGPWLAAIAWYKWKGRLRSLKSEAAEPLGENIGIPDHGDSVVPGSTFQQLSAELKPPQAEAIRLVKLEGQALRRPAVRRGSRFR